MAHPSRVASRRPRDACTQGSCPEGRRAGSCRSSSEASGASSQCCSTARPRLSASGTTDSTHRGNGLETIFVISRSASAHTSCRATLRPDSSSRRKRSTPGDDNRSPALACLNSNIVPLSAPRSLPDLCSDFLRSAHAGQGCWTQTSHRDEGRPVRPPSRQAGGSEGEVRSLRAAAASGRRTASRGCSSRARRQSGRELPPRRSPAHQGPGTRSW